MDSFRALVVDKQNDAFDVGIRELAQKDLPEGEVDASRGIFEH